MPNNPIFSRLERLYAKMETTYGQAVAPTNTDALRLIKGSFDNVIPVLVRRDKFGSYTPPAGVRGRVSSKWNYEGSLVGSGTAGTVPPPNVLWQLMFSSAPTVAGGTSVTYALSKNNVSASLWDFRDPTTASQRCAMGSIMKTATIQLGQDVAEWQCDGESKYVLESPHFASADVEEKGGLGSFPAEPGSPVTTDGNIIAGFTGALTVDGQSLASIRTATIKVETGVYLTTDTFGSYYATGIERDTRKITFGFSLYEDDSAGQATIFEAADAKTQIAAVVQVGTIAGSIYTFNLTNIQLEAPTRDDSRRKFQVVYGDSIAHGTTAGEDELTLVIT